MALRLYVISVYKGYMNAGGGVPVLVLVIVFGVLMQGMFQHALG